MIIKKKSFWLVLSLVLIVLSISILSTTVMGAPDYQTAFKDAIIFYDGNKCGPNVGADNVFSSWRGACHTTDGSDVGLNLTGGFHDAGDHVKFGLPQGYAASILGWSLYEYKGVLDATGNTAKMLSTLKYFTDYFLASHPNANTFYYQVGDGDADHTYWGPPEQQTGSRTTLYKADASLPASDICGVTSGALTLMYLNYKNVDATYANRCLQAAKDLYALGKNYQGYGSGQSFYQSQSYWDDLSWAAMWLYTVERNSSYLTEIDSYLAHNTKFGDSPFYNKWTMCWDDMYMAVFCKMAGITGAQKYKDAMTYNLDYWKNSLTRTPAGLRYLNNWGVLRYAASESMLALLYYKQTGDTSLTSFAKSQIDYIFTNPSGLSYMVGFGGSWPQHPHHRAANGYTYANGENTKPAKHTLTGALVGGPDQSDNYLDDVNQYQYTEVAIDYNAGLVGALAGLIGPINTPTPTPTGTVNTPTPTPTATPTPTGTVNTPTPTPTTTTRSAFSQIEAESYDTQSGIQTESCAEGGRNIGWIENGDYVVYNNIDFRFGAVDFYARVASATSGGTIEIRLDGLTGALVGTCTVAGTGGWQNWTTKNGTVSGASGVHNLYLRFTGGSGYLFNINYFQFYAGGVITPTPTVTPTPTTPVNTPTPTPTIPNGGYVVNYAIQNDWGSGATVNVTIINNTTTGVNGWTLAFSFSGNQTISNLWNGTYTQSGASVSVKDVGYNATIGANGGSTSFGFNINYSGTNAKPASFTLNGTACTVQ